MLFVFTPRFERVHDVRHVLKLRISERSMQRVIDFLLASFFAAKTIPLPRALSSQQKPKIFADEVVSVFIFSEFALEFWKRIVVGPCGLTASVSGERCRRVARECTRNSATLQLLACFFDGCGLRIVNVNGSAGDNRAFWGR